MFSKCRVGNCGLFIIFEDKKTKNIRLNIVGVVFSLSFFSDGQDAVSTKEIMAWSTVADPILYEMDYQERSLIIQKEGYYYVYSKIFFLDNGAFHHYVNQKTEKYAGKSINLLQSRVYTESHKASIKSNSYLGGVFYLDKGDAIFVEVSDTAKIMRHKPTENFFGAYMI